MITNNHSDRACRRMKSILLVGALLAPLESYAQYAKSDALIPPEFQMVDENGVNLSSGVFSLPTKVVSIGDNNGGVAYNLDAKGGYYFINNLNMNDNWSMFLVTGVSCNRTGPADNTCISVDLSSHSSTFKINGSVYKRYYGCCTLPEDSDRLTFSQGYTYTSKDGIKYTFGVGDIPYNAASNVLHASFYSAGRVYLVDKIEYPSGDLIRIFYKKYGNYVRKQAVVSSRGYMLKYVYSSPIESVANGSNFSAINPAQVVAVNTAVDYCDPNADTCTFSKSWPTASFAVNMSTRELAITLPSGRVRKIATDANMLPVRAYSQFGDVSIQYTNSMPYSSAASYTSPINTVKSINSNGNIWQYSLTSVQGGQTLLRTNSMTMTNPQSITSGMDTYFYNNYTSYTLRPAGKSQSRVYQYNYANYKGSMTDFGYQVYLYSNNTRGDVTQTQISPRVGTGLDPINTYADFDATCTYTAKCNKPNWTRDENGGQTDYVYDNQTGLPTKISFPADVNGIRPVKRLTYTPRYAWVRAAGGGYVRAEAPIWLLTAEKTCRTTTTSGDGCGGGAADETVITFDYGPDSGAVGNNLLPIGRVVTAQDADGVIRSYRICADFDSIGNRTSETGPRAGLSSCF
ncbi:hypothetical protein ACQKOH_21925 [Sphingomonas sp. NPDC092331]|jgi:hypothetical protein|uniref:hypothetical protein n=1 Tax=unclassified Sphingomonas TaxID=196159 RepID=UPI0031F4ED7F